jgi:hypothetical protein
MWRVTSTIHSMRKSQKSSTTLPDEPKKTTAKPSKLAICSCSPTPIFDDRMVNIFSPNVGYAKRLGIYEYFVYS